ncbi:MAG: phenylalanine--tRNA ligase subunit alpha [Actinomycetota bacterium]|nr:phenylalanine--tRNA ligase subunit alpha [Actinomycetota bacterium]
MSDIAGLIQTVEREQVAALERIALSTKVAELEEAEIAAIGRKAPMSALKRELGGLSEEDRRTLGRLLNDARLTIEAALDGRRGQLQAREEEAALQHDSADITLPPRLRAPGHPHPISIVIDRIVDVFVGMGYRVAEGPEVETDFYSFEALNMPADHPARSGFDTMYLSEGVALRPHTSPVQVRAMMEQSPPIYVVVPGRCYRRDSFDASHSPVFHQVEGLAVDRGISFADLKGTLAEFARALFGPEERVRFRPSYFPFTEPSAEIDVSCPTCHGAGCASCGWSGWLEIMGAGMVHPNELRAVGYDPQDVSGFAFGMGVERVAMVAYGIKDIRQFFENDMRFLAGFAG